MRLPNDPLLMSMVNTKHRDDYVSLDALCEDLNEDRAAREAKLTGIGCFYDQQRNQFALHSKESQP